MSRDIFRSPFASILGGFKNSSSGEISIHKFGGMGWDGVGKFKYFLSATLLLSVFVYLITKGKWFTIVSTIRNISGFQKYSKNNHYWCLCSTFQNVKKKSLTSNSVCNNPMSQIKSIWFIGSSWNAGFQIADTQKCLFRSRFLVAVIETSSHRFQQINSGLKGHWVAYTVEKRQPLQ